MGPLVIGGDTRSLASIMGSPHRTLQQPNDATALIYFVETQGQHPYLVVTLEKDRIVALQISGPRAANSFGFNHVNLGDDTAALMRHFGSPSNMGPSGVKDTDLWSYGHWPFSFEIKDDHVVSIRVNEPGH